MAGAERPSLGRIDMVRKREVRGFQDLIPGTEPEGWNEARKVLADVGRRVQSRLASGKGESVVRRRRSKRPPELIK